MYQLHEYEIGKAGRIVAGWALLCDGLFDDLSGNHTMLTLATPVLRDWLREVGPAVLAAPGPHEYAWVHRLMLLADVGEFRCVHLPVGADAILEVLLAPGVVPSTWPQPDRVVGPSVLEHLAKEMGQGAADSGLAWLRMVGLIAD